MTSTAPSEPQQQAIPAASVALSGREAVRFFRQVSGPDPLPALSALPGTNGLVRVPAIGQSVFIVRHPAHMRHILVTNQDTYVKGVDYRILGILLGRGLLTNVDQEDWQRNRSLVQPLFARRHLGPMARHMVEAADDWLDALDAATPEGGELDANTAMMGLTLDVVGRALFGQGIDGATTEVVGESMTELLDAGGAFFRIAPIARAINDRTRVEFEDVFRVRRRHWQRVEHHKAVMDRIVHGLIDARLSAGSPDSGDDLLSLLLAARDERGEQGMDREQVRDEVMTFLGAGHETTANGMSWMWMLLSQHPDVRRRLEAEVDEVLQGRRPTFEDVERLPYTNAVLQEAMRLYPPVPVVSRVSATDDEIDGVQIPANSVMILPSYLVQRDPAFWENPEGFDPDRFLESGAARPRQSFMPFGAGRRICVGQGFALIEGVLLTAMTVQRFQLDLMPGYRPVRRVAVTMRPRHGLPMALRRRTDAPPIVR